MVYNIAGGRKSRQKKVVRNGLTKLSNALLTGASDCMNSSLAFLGHPDSRRSENGKVHYMMISIERNCAPPAISSSDKISIKGAFSTRPPSIVYSVTFGDTFTVRTVRIQRTKLKTLDGN